MTAGVAQHVERNVVEDDVVAEGLGDVAKLDVGCGHGKLSAASLSAISL